VLDGGLDGGWTGLDGVCVVGSMAICLACP
jgi:hypothetical protein